MIKERYIFLEDLNVDILIYLDPFLEYFFSLFEPDQPVFSLACSNAPFFLFFILSIILFSGILFSGTGVSGGVFRTAVETVLSGAFMTGLLYLLSPDGVLYLLLYPLLLLLVANRSSNIILSGIFFLWGMFLSGTLSFLYVGIALFLKNKGEKGFGTTIFSVVSIVISFIISLYFSSRSVVFDYPRTSGLAPLSPFTNMGNVVFGVERIPFSLYSPAFIEQHIHSIYLALCVGVPAFFIVFASFLYRMRYKRPEKEVVGISVSIYETIYKTAIFFSVFFLGWSFFYVGNKFPLSLEGILFRVIPGVIWRPLPYLFSGIAIIVILYSFNRVSRGPLRNMLLLSASVLVFVYYMAHPAAYLKISSYENPPAVVVRNFKEVSADKYLPYTPSRFLLSKYFNDDVSEMISSRDHRHSLTNVSLREDITCNVSASVNQDAAGSALGGDHRSRWSTGRPQAAGDWFEIECERAVSAKQIHLSIVHYKSDFPRGLLLQVEKEGQMQNVLQLDEWFGSVQYTDSGLPYFGAQGDVILDLPYEVSSRVFRFTLTRGDSVFDWSIAKILFYSRP